MSSAVENPADVGDEILRWKVVEPGDVIEAFGGALFNPTVSYPLVVVPAEETPHFRNAIESATIGRIGNGERTDFTAQLKNVKPLHTYHLGYKENEFWHWTTYTVPIKLFAMQCTDKTITMHADFSHSEDVVGIRVNITTPSTTALRTDREYAVNDLPIDEITELQVIVFRNLLPSCAYFIRAWPVMRDGSVGRSSLCSRVVTQQGLALFFQEVGDTYLRIAFRRPPLRPPLYPQVKEEDAVVEEYVLHVWEDPTECLLRNATRLSRGRQPQRYPLRKSEVTGKHLPCGVTQVLVIDNLKPDTPHFVTLQARDRVARGWDPRVLRVRVKTCPELTIPLQAPRLTSTSITFDWHRARADALPFCDLDVSFPEATNLFDDRDVTHPYIGSHVVELPDNQAWSPPTVLDENDSSHIDTSKSHTRTQAFEISITNVATSSTRIVRSHDSLAAIDALSPATSYIIKIRSVPLPLKNARGNGRSPWSRPYVFMTPSELLCREIHRTRTTLTLAWGRHLPTLLQPLDYEPGRYKYLPDMSIQDRSYEWYYYLEPLPFLCGPQVDQADISDSEDEEEVYADGCITGSGVGYLGKRSRILNRQPRPTPISFPCSVDEQEFTAASLLLFGPSENSTSEGNNRLLTPILLTNETGADVVVTADVSALHVDSAPSSPSAPSSASTVLVLNDAMRRLLQTNPYSDSLAVDSAEAYVLENGWTLLRRASFPGVFGTHTFVDLPVDTPMMVYFFYERSRDAIPVLAKEIDVFTLPMDARCCPRPDNIQEIALSQALWSGYLCDTQLSSDRKATICLGEVSEVFVTLHLGRMLPNECASSLQLTLLEQNAMEWGPLTCTTENDEEDDDEYDDVLETAPAEYLLSVEEVRVIDGVRTVIGDRRIVYLCTTAPEVQLIDLTAASRYEVCAATLSHRTHRWTEFSEPITFTTVQKLLFELEEISTEYVKLKWGRNTLERISEYVLHICDVSSGEKSLMSGSESVVGRSLLRANCVADGASAAFVKKFAEKHEITTVDTNYRLDTASELRPNALFDLMVVPTYTNGQRGLNSNVLRLLHCSLSGDVVEAGVAHLRVEWEPPALHEFFPRCGGSSVEDSVTHVCLIRLRDVDRKWERTVQCNPMQGWYILEGLQPQTQYDAHISLIALLPRCNCCTPPDPSTVIRCTEPFSISGETLGQPTARVSSLWEDAVELEWFFEAEPRHQGDVSLELRLFDRKHGETMASSLSAPANGKHGKGAHIVKGLAAGRSYSALLRQQYSRGTWGEWREVLPTVMTLAKLQISIVAISETAFRIRAYREKVDCTAFEGMEYAVQKQPCHYRYKVERIENPNQLSSLGKGTKKKKVKSTADREEQPTAASTESSAPPGENEEALDSERSSTPPPEVIQIEVHDGDEDDTVVLIETRDVDSSLPGFEPNTPYRITAQQWSLDEWGAQSAPIHAYTLNNMVPTVTRRCDSYFEIHCARDKRLPQISTPLCSPHNENSSVQYSRLVGVTISATSLITNILTTRFLLACTEATCQAVVGRVVDLDACHPYRVDIRTEYADDETCPHMTSLATITAPIPIISIAALGEDFCSLLIDRKSAPPSYTQAMDTFHTLASTVRHASNEGQVADVLEFRFTFEAIQFDDLDLAEKKQAFQSGAEVECTSIPCTALAMTKEGLIPEIPYNVFLVTVDEKEFVGRRHLIGAISTRAFCKIYVSKLSENFAEIEWRELQDEIGDDHTVSTVSGAISKKFGRYARIPPAEGYDVNNNGNIKDEYEFVIAEDIEVPDVSRPATRTSLVEYRQRCHLVEQLNPETQYFVVGRVRRTVPDGKGGWETHLGPWGGPARFATLALLVLRIVHCSLDFANIAWQDPVSMKTVERTSHLHGAGNLAPSLFDSSTLFTKLAVEEAAREGHSAALAGSGAQPVRFQLRLMHATPEGHCGSVIEDMFVVTNDGIHTIEHLVPGLSYAVSMRVCYEGLSGSWVAPAVFRTDKFPEPKYIAITRRDVEMELDVELGGELREGDEFKVPDRNHRLYEVVLNDSDMLRFVLHHVNHPTRLFIGGLIRGRRYRAAIREVINGVRYGSFVHLCSFWIQPYPPVMVRLLECRDGVCLVEWTVIEKKTQQEREQEEDIGFVYHLEQGTRNPRDATQGENWNEVVITDTTTHRFKWTERAPANVQFSDLCFRVRASKCFVFQNGIAYKTPVWGDWSLIAFWDEAQPPKPVRKLTIEYCSDTSAIAKWDLPEQWEVHPNLRFIVKLRVAPLPPGAADDSVGGSAALGTVDAMSNEWYVVGTSSVCAMVLPSLAKATTYMVGVMSESSFGVNERMISISFTTRYVPNEEPAPSLESIAARPVVSIARAKALYLPGLRPVDPYAVRLNNLYDKYEEPKKLRLRAVVRMAGMLERSQHGKAVQRRFQGIIRRLIAVSKLIHRYAVDLMMKPNFKPNEVYSPEQVSRVRFGLNPEDTITTWTKEVEQFFESEEHQELRRTFSTFRSDALAVKKRKKFAPLRRSYSEVRTLPAKSHNSDDDGVSWTADVPSSARAEQRVPSSQGSRSPPRTAPSKMHTENASRKIEGRQLQPLPLPPSSAATSTLATPTAASPSGSSNGMGVSSDFRSSTDRRQRSNPSNTKSGASGRLPSIRSKEPNHALSSAGEGRDSAAKPSGTHHEDRTGSMSGADGTARTIVPEQQNVDPPPMLPALFRRHLITAIQSSQGNQRKVQ